MSGAVNKRGHDWEYWYTIIALLFITSALTPLLAILGGAQVEDRGDSNPFRFGLATLLYLISGLLALKSVGKSLELLQKNPLSLALLLLPLISMMWSVDPALTFRRAVACALTTVFCIYLVGRLSPEELLKRLMFTLLIGGVASIFYSVLLPQYGMHFDAGNYGAFRGVYGHKNELGRVSVIAIIVAYFVRPTNQSERSYRYLALSVFLFLLAVSQSATNWLIMLGLVGFIPMLALFRSERLSLPLRILLVFSCGLTVTLLVSVNAEALLAAVGRDDTFTGRETLWRGVIAVVSERYPILGAGYGAFFSNLGGVRELFFLVSSWGSIPEHAHNGYMNVWADLGAVGLVTLVLFLVTSTVHLARRAVAEPDRPAWGALCALMFFFLVNNISSSVAMQHSDIAWVTILLASFYARSAMPSDVRLRPIGLGHGSRSAWPMTSALDTRSNARPRSPSL